MAAECDEVPAPLNLLRRRPLYLVRASETDALTSLPAVPTARAADEEIARSGRGPSCLALVEVDHMERIEDAHDVVLRAMAVRARDAIRDSDVLVRYAGDRFLLVLSGTDADGAMLAADRVRAEAAASPVATASGPLSVTVSIGLAEIALDESLAAAISRADSSLLRAQASAGDRVVLETSAA